jgi:hypothetical protein
MTPLIINQEPKVHLKIHKQIKHLSIACALIATLGACGNSTLDKIVDKVEKNVSTNISYVNALENSTTFYLKSSVYNANVFAERFKIEELLAAQVSENHEHQWIKGASQSVFAIENSITNGSRVSYNTELNENSDFWAIAWNEANDSVLSVFEREDNNKTGVYSVRIFTTAKLAVKEYDSNDTLGITEPGVVTTAFEIDECSDLIIGENEIDLCQVATLGNSYLVIADTTGQILVVQE